MIRCMDNLAVSCARSTSAVHSATALSLPGALHCKEMRVAARNAPVDLDIPGRRPGGEHASDGAVNAVGQVIATGRRQAASAGGLGNLVGLHRWVNGACMHGEGHGSGPCPWHWPSAPAAAPCWFWRCARKRIDEGALSTCRQH